MKMLQNDATVGLSWKPAFLVALDLFLVCHLRFNNNEFQWCEIEILDIQLVEQRLMSILVRLSFAEELTGDINLIPPPLTSSHFTPDGTLSTRY